MSMAMVYTEFAKDIEKYLISKLPALPEHTAQEIGAHISNKIIICMSDMLREYEKDMKLTIRKGSYRRKSQEGESNG